MTPSTTSGMSPIVRTVCGWLKGFILLYGIYIVVYGHLTPGGGFAGGVIAACAFVLILLAEGPTAALSTFSRRAASTFDSMGVLVFWGLAVLCVGVLGTVLLTAGSTVRRIRKLGAGPQRRVRPQLRRLQAIQQPRPQRPLLLRLPRLRAPQPRAVVKPDRRARRRSAPPPCPPLIDCCAIDCRAMVHRWRSRISSATMVRLGVRPMTVMSASASSR